MASSGIAAEDYRIKERLVPKGFEHEASFFELLKMPKEPNVAFDAGHAPLWNLAELDKYLPKEGIEFLDINHAFEGRIDRKRITRELKDRSGEVFQAFAHLSSIYSLPYKQYSELHFSKRSADTSVVEIADWYKIMFKRVGTQVIIIRWEYMQLEGD